MCSRTIRLTLAKILSAHGVHGLLRIQSFTSPPKALFDYKNLTCCDQKNFSFSPPITSLGLKNGKALFLARIPQIMTREMAKKFKNTLVFAHVVPEKENKTFYWESLKGMTVKKDTKPYAFVKGLHNFGAGDLLELSLLINKNKQGDHSIFLPFTNMCIKAIDTQANTLILAEGAIPYLEE